MDEPILRAGRDKDGNLCWVVETPGGGSACEFYCGHQAIEHMRHLRQLMGREPGPG